MNNVPRQYNNDSYDKVCIENGDIFDKSRGRQWEVGVLKLYGTKNSRGVVGIIDAAVQNKPS